MRRADCQAYNCSVKPKRQVRSKVHCLRFVVLFLATTPMGIHLTETDKDVLKPTNRMRISKPRSYDPEPMI